MNLNDKPLSIEWLRKKKSRKIHQIEYIIIIKKNSRKDS